MSLYAGMDLHSSDTYLEIINDKFKRVFKKRLRNDLSMILVSQSSSLSFWIVFFKTSSQFTRFPAF